jgi:RNase H-fold protein (predicted Holliday junction resolvase)
MKLSKINIPKSKLDTIPEKEKVFFIQLMHFLNELNILQKCAIVSSNKLASLTTIEKRSQISQAHFFIRTLAGKLDEGWKMISKNFVETQLSREYENLLSQKGKESLSELIGYFNDENNKVRLIRNKFAFHYDKEKIKEEIDKIPQEELLEMYISEHRVNCLYSISDTVVNWAILNSIDSSNSHRAMDILIGEIAIKVSGWFREFCGDCVFIIVKKLKLNSTEIEIPEPPSIDDVKLPYFVKRAE